MTLGTCIHLSMTSSWSHPNLTLTYISQFALLSSCVKVHISVTIDLQQWYLAHAYILAWPLNAVIHIWPWPLFYSSLTLLLLHLGPYLSNYWSYSSDIWHMHTSAWPLNSVIHIWPLPIFHGPLGMLHCLSCLCNHESWSDCLPWSFLGQVC